MGEAPRAQERGYGKMYGKVELIRCLEDMGLATSDTVLVHSSFRRIAGEGGVAGGADTVLEALSDYFGRTGLLVFPALTWKFGYLLDDAGNLRLPGDPDSGGFRYWGDRFDVRRSATHGIGILPELFRSRPGVVRSLSPTHSVCALGPDAEAYTAGHAQTGSVAWDSPWGRLYGRGAKILFCGTDMACNTFLHAVEEHAGVVPGLMMEHMFRYTVTDAEGNTFQSAYRRHEPGHSHYYDRVRPELTALGIVREGRFGSALTYVADAAPMADRVVEMLRAEPLLFTRGYNRRTQDAGGPEEDGESDL